MAINSRHVAKIEESFNEAFPNVKINKTPPQEDGNIERVAITTQVLNSSQICSLAILASDMVSNEFSIRRSGTGLTVTIV